MATIRRSGRSGDLDGQAGLVQTRHPRRQHRCWFWGRLALGHVVTCCNDGSEAGAVVLDVTLIAESTSPIRIVMDFDGVNEGADPDGRMSLVRAWLLGSILVTGLALAACSDTNRESAIETSGPAATSPPLAATSAHATTVTNGPDDATGLAAFHEPYADPAVNYLYNLLFCDDLDLFRIEEAEADAAWAAFLAEEPDLAAMVGTEEAEGDSVWPTLLAEESDLSALESIAQNDELEGRVRALAYNRLRHAGHPVPRGVVLGVIVEVPLDLGLDVLAAFSEGGVRYLNQSGRVAVFEGIPEIEELAKDVVAASQMLAAEIGPWDGNRLPPPQDPIVRVTLLASDGLYFGEGTFEQLLEDDLGGPLLSKATDLLVLATGLAAAHG